MEAVSCGPAGPAGGGICGTWCESLCRLTGAACTGANAAYASAAECAALCGWLPDGGSPGAITGDSVQCRAQHAAAAVTGDAPSECAAAELSGGGTCVDPLPTCAAYCGRITAACTGGLAQFSDASTCLSWCLELGAPPVGANGDVGVNTLGCRSAWVTTAESAPGLACAPAGPTGGNVCGSWCDNYCHLALHRCAGGSPLYPDTAACLTACGAFPQGGAPGDLAGDSVQCRVAWLLSPTAEIQVLCAAASQSGGAICALPGVTLVVNEVDYDTVGPVEDLQFIELLNVGVIAQDLTDVRVEHVNGADGGVLASWDLVAAGATLGAGQRLVIGTDAVRAGLAPGVPSLALGTVLQGGPDGVRIVRISDGSVVDGVAWEGALPGTGEGSPPTVVDSNTVAMALARCPDGADTDDNAADFGLSVPPTPGADNGCSGGGPAPTWTADIAPLLKVRCTGCHDGAGSGGHNLATVYGDAFKTPSNTFACSGTTTVGACALKRVLNGTMPFFKGCTGDPAQDAGNAWCLTAAEQAVLQAWVAGGMPQ